MSGGLYGEKTDRCSIPSLQNYQLVVAIGALKEQCPLLSLGPLRWRLKSRKSLSLYSTKAGILGATSLYLSTNSADGRAHYSGANLCHWRFIGHIVGTIYNYRLLSLAAFIFYLGATYGRLLSICRP